MKPQEGARWQVFCGVQGDICLVWVSWLLPEKEKVYLEKPKEFRVNMSTNIK
jgi:hypothetical protein